MKPAIRVENLSKQYRIGTAKRGPTRNLTESILDSASNLWRGLTGHARGGNGTDEFWALRDVSFDVQPGEVVGIIGRNGAGKSTLLKILSRIAEPTKGRALVRGRTSSLLEVGTGFHPELTGRENIYLNGSILGMSRAEIARKFDQIAAFAEIDQFLDTPVKRYSSGMYVRLAFAVAAHLNPEILVVDEVLAVGDAQFQKKCIGKMHSVANKGRTILFVSHNVAAVKYLCTHGLLLEDGRVALFGNINEVIDAYSRAGTASTNEQGRIVHSSDELRIAGSSILRNGTPGDSFQFGDTLSLLVEINCSQPVRASLEIVLRDSLQYPLAFFGTGITLGREFHFSKGNNQAAINIPSLPLASGAYYLDIGVALTGKRYLDYRECCRQFSVECCDPYKTGKGYIQNGKGSVYIPFECDSSAPLIECA